MQITKGFLGGRIVVIFSLFIKQASWNHQDFFAVPDWSSSELDVVLRELEEAVATAAASAAPPPHPKPSTLRH